MTLQRAKPLPGWLFEDTLTSTECNFIQTEYIKAVDGYGGGYYPNASLIEFGGSLKIPTIVGNTSFSNLLTASTFNVTGNATIGTNSATSLQINSSLTVAEGTSFAKQVFFNASAGIQVSGPLVYTGAGRPTESIFVLPNLDSNFDGRAYKNLFIQVATAPHIYTLTFASPVIGDYCIVFNQSNNTQQINHSATTTNILPNTTVKFIYSGSFFTVLRFTT